MAIALVAQSRDKGNGEGLFEQIGRFLAEQRLDPEPGNYAFAHAILSEPDSPLAKAVYAIIDGGVRLTRRDVSGLGREIAMSPKDAKKRADALVARAQMSIECVDDTLVQIRAHTQDFGRELAASADAIERSHGSTGGSDAITAIARITSDMRARVANAEAQLEQATNQAAELRAQLEEALDDARRDPLTDLPNRRAYQDGYDANAKAGQPMCLGVCDIDRFKLINDRFGHAVGDRVLKAVASTLAEVCEGALVARYGGEEFVVLFDHDDLAAARTQLDRVRWSHLLGQFGG